MSEQHVNSASAPTQSPLVRIGYIVRYDDDFFYPQILRKKEAKKRSKRENKLRASVGLAQTARIVPVEIPWDA